MILFESVPPPRIENDKKSSRPRTELAPGRVPNRPLEE